MRRTVKIQSAVILCLLSVFLLVGYTFPPNPAEDLVVDSAEILSSDTSDLIRDVNRQLSPTGAQVAVVTIASLDGDDIEGYSVELFREWGIGDKEKNNGVLMVIALAEKKVRIEVGYGLEGAVPDGVAGSIIRQYITPAFREGDYDTGVEQAFNAIVTRIEDEYDFEVSAAGYERNEVEEKSSSGKFGFVWVLLFILLFSRPRRWLPSLFYGGFFNNGRRGGGGFFGGGRFGGGGGGGGGGRFGGGSSGGGGASGGW